MRVANGGIAGFTDGSGAVQWNCAIVTRTHCHCLRQERPGANAAFVSMPNSDMIGRVRRDHYAGHTNSPSKTRSETIKMVGI